MTNRFNLKLILAGLAALIVAGFIGYSLRGSSMIKSSNVKSTVTTTNIKGTQTQTTNSTSSQASPLKAQCTDAIQSYATNARAKAEAMAKDIRAKAAANGNNISASQYQPQIDQLLAYIKTMQANIKTLQNCISKADQGHNFSAQEMAEINAVIAASKQ